MGMVAVAITFALSHILRWPERLRLTTDTSPETIALDSPVARAHELEVGLLDELEIEPVVDVLRENDPELKRAAIEVLTKQGGPGAVRVLVGLLHSPSPDARFFSSIALSRLEDEISRAILAAQHDVEEDPDDPEIREQRAQLYLDYALSGFLEGVTKDYYLDMARETLENVLPDAADPDGVKLRLARVCSLQGSIGEAAALLDELARSHPTDAEIHLLRMDVIFQFGDFRELASYAGRVADAVGSTSDANPDGIIPWWADARQPRALSAG
jgi:hypothetical protein